MNRRNVLRSLCLLAAAPAVMLVAARDSHLVLHRVYHTNGDVLKLADVMVPSWYHEKMLDRGWRAYEAGRITRAENIRRENSDYLFLRSVA